ncbi:MAG TPA: CehA/McbA family metallohydrolase [Myxococcales bacterium]|nr:CehA/McbA family metallohydrolase [Myxococcales bacterium]
MKGVRRALALAAAVAAGAGAAADPAPLVLDGVVPEDASRFFELPFEVPAGIEEIEVRHGDLSATNVLDWGLFDPERFRGWGGGNEEPAVVGVRAASRSYLPGPLPPGTWRVSVGKAKVSELPARYHVEILLRQTATLAPQANRRPYAPAAPLSRGSRWYAGDFHVHSRESGDARPTLDEIASYARGTAGLDFAVITDHNTVSHLDFVVDAQARHLDFLFVPGLEITTYWGHANAYGMTRWVDFRLDASAPSIQAAVDQVRASGALFAINHPVQDLGDLCIGCSWSLTVPATGVDGLEVANAGYRQMGALFNDPSLAFWDSLATRGIKAAAVGGSDDHRAGREDTPYQSPIGQPTTLVWADELSAAAIVDGVARGHTVVKAQGVGDPMVELRAGSALGGDTVVSTQPLALIATVTGGRGYQVRFVHDGAPLPPVTIDADPFTAELEVTPPEQCEDRFRAEVLVDGRPRTITNHLWVARAAGTGCANGASPPPASLSGDGCACGAASAPAGTALVMAAALAALLRARAVRASRRRAAPASAAGTTARWRPW